MEKFLERFAGTNHKVMSQLAKLTPRGLPEYVVVNVEAAAFESLFLGPYMLRPWLIDPKTFVACSLASLMLERSQTEHADLTGAGGVVTATRRDVVYSSLRTLCTAVAIKEVKGAELGGHAGYLDGLCSDEVVDHVLRLGGDNGVSYILQDPFSPIPYPGSKYPGMSFMDIVRKVGRERALGYFNWAVTNGYFSVSYDFWTFLQVWTHNTLRRSLSTGAYVKFRYAVTDWDCGLETRESQRGIRSWLTNSERFYRSRLSSIGKRKSELGSANAQVLDNFHFEIPVTESELHIRAFMQDRRLMPWRLLPVNRISDLPTAVPPNRISTSQNILAPAELTPYTWYLKVSTTLFAYHGLVGEDANTRSILSYIPRSSKYPTHFAFSSKRILNMFRDCSANGQPLAVFGFPVKAGLEAWAVHSKGKEIYRSDWERSYVYANKETEYTLGRPSNTPWLSPDSLTRVSSTDELHGLFLGSEDRNVPETRPWFRLYMTEKQLVDESFELWVGSKMAHASPGNYGVTQVNSGPARNLHEYEESSAYTSPVSDGVSTYTLLTTEETHRQLLKQEVKPDNFEEMLIEHDFKTRFE